VLQEVYSAGEADGRVLSAGEDESRMDQPEVFGLAAEGPTGENPFQPGLVDQPGAREDRVAITPGQLRCTDDEVLIETGHVICCELGVRVAFYAHGPVFGEITGLVHQWTYKSETDASITARRSDSTSEVRPVRVTQQCERFIGSQLIDESGQQGRNIVIAGQPLVRRRPPHPRKIGIDAPDIVATLEDRFQRCLHLSMVDPGAVERDER
jgi:hypothetical protein